MGPGNKSAFLLRAQWLMTDERCSNLWTNLAPAATSATLTPFQDQDQDQDQDQFFHLFCNHMYIPMFLKHMVIIIDIQRNISSSPIIPLHIIPMDQFFSPAWSNLFYIHMYMFLKHFIIIDIQGKLSSSHHILILFENRLSIFRLTL